jgi:hypothetical protein
VECERALRNSRSYYKLPEFEEARKKAQEESKAKTLSLLPLASRCTTFEEFKKLLRTHKGEDTAKRATDTYEAVGWLPSLLYLYLF